MYRLTWACCASASMSLLCMWPRCGLCVGWISGGDDIPCSRRTWKVLRCAFQTSQPPWCTWGMRCMLAAIPWASACDPLWQALMLWLMLPDEEWGPHWWRAIQRYHLLVSALASWPQSSCPLWNTIVLHTCMLQSFEVHTRMGERQWHWGVEHPLWSHQWWASSCLGPVWLGHLGQLLPGLGPTPGPILGHLDALREVGLAGHIAGVPTARSPSDAESLSSHSSQRPPWVCPTVGWFLQLQNWAWVLVLGPCWGILSEGKMDEKRLCLWMNNL